MLVPWFASTGKEERGSSVVNIAEREKILTSFQ